MTTTPEQNRSVSRGTDAARRRNSMIRIAVLLVIGAAAIGYMAYRARAKSAQAEVSRHVRELGGAVIYDHNGKRTTEPHGPAWLRGVLGDEYFVSVFAVQISNPDFTDEKLAELVDDLHSLPDLKIVEFESPKLTDACLEPLSKLTEVRMIQFWGKQLSPAALHKLDDALTRAQVLQSQRQY